MKKCQNKKIFTKEKGQLSIFLGITLLIFLSALAFVINVGLFVRAKINLQNAVDAGAWAGAAVQARQLTNIAYLNWEMRNTYKEWMFKYYVVGQLSLPRVRSHNLNNQDKWKQPEPNKVKFRLKPFYDRSDGKHFKAEAYDKFNLPTICIHFSGTHNLCETYVIPGLPRFEAVGMPGISEKTEAFLNRLTAQKAADCTRRSSINFDAARNWAFGTGKTGEGLDARVLSDRVGAWIEALLLSLRIRNLEMIVNRPPEVEPICFLTPYSTIKKSCKQINDLDTEVTNIPALNERPLKAFWSAFRSLSKELQNSFLMTELRPNPYEAPPGSLSNFLIPPRAPIGQSGIVATTKHYLDLQVYPLNLVTYFTTFVSSTGTFAASSGTVTSEANCKGSRTGLPVPSYLFGFVKNPKVITYYAIKGEANFTGLFFPFDSLQDGITLRAFAAAKPYGGRIGPRLFGIDSNQTVRARGGKQARSLPYISGLKTGVAKWVPGEPIPLGKNFWITNHTQDIGGNPKQASNIKFGIPNLLYDFKNDISELNKHLSGSLKLQTIQRAPHFDAHINSSEIFGLYSMDQYKAFISNMVPVDFTTPTPGVDSKPDLRPGPMRKSISYIRAPTKYEALNYLIPTPQDEGQELQHVPNITKAEKLNGRYKIFAPLWGADTLYTQVSDIENTVKDFLKANETGINRFISALENVSNDMRATSQATAKKASAYLKAADGIWNPAVGPGGNTAQCESIAGKFYQFFFGEKINFCMIGDVGITPLPFAITEYLHRQSSDPIFDKYYTNTYVLKPDTGVKQLMSAYHPGPRHGATNEGVTQHPFLPSKNKLALRNFYSTKFISLDKLSTQSDAPYNEKGVYMESRTLGQEPSDTEGSSFRNALPSSETSEIRKLKYSGTH